MAWQTAYLKTSKTHINLASNEEKEDRIIIASDAALNKIRLVLGAYDRMACNGSSS